MVGDSCMGKWLKTMKKQVIVVVEKGIELLKKINIYGH
jgi:hypothetical protein